MDVLKKTDLEELIEHASSPCISIYMPTHRASVETRQDPIRLKNLLRECEASLEARAVRKPEIQELLDPIRALVDDYDFWQHQSDGLAMFRSRDLFRKYRVALKLPELALVGDRFHSKPLLALLTSDCRYVILALSQNKIRIFRASRDTITEMEPSGMPSSLAAVVGERRADRTLQNHSASGAAGGAPNAVFHGHGSGGQEKKETLLAFFRQIDGGMRDVLGEERAPLILAAVDHLYPIYRQANSYSELLDEWIPGNPEALSAQELHRRAAPIAESHFLQTQQRAAARFLEFLDTPRTSSKLAEILPAARQGRIEALFVAVGVQLWGRFDPSTNETAVVDHPAPESQDLLNLAATSTYLARGSVYALPPDQVPGEGPLAAVFRY
ncbi:MAG: hypothetical protein ABI759_24530 [Candidatus Solibacter sp.]